MAQQRKSRRRDAQLGFDALAIEGALLSPEWLARVASLEAPSQAEADYDVEPGLTLRDEISRYWRMAQSRFVTFQTAVAQLPSAGRDASRPPLHLGGQAALTPLFAKAAAKDPALDAATAFVVPLLQKCFGFTSLAAAQPVTISDRLYPIGHAALDGKVPVVVAPAGAGLDSALPIFGDAGRNAAPLACCKNTSMRPKSASGAWLPTAPHCASFGTTPV